MKALFILSSAMLLLWASSLAVPVFAVPDSIFLTVPPGVPGGATQQSCITLVLPDDSGWIGKGEFAYTLTMTPGSVLAWSDFSQQTTRKISENNTALIPICFYKRTNNTCGEQFTLTIDSTKGTRRAIVGGACESGYGGASTAPPADNRSVGDNLNQNYGAFDVAFSKNAYTAQPGQNVSVTAIVGS